jgi:putative membrane protein
MTSRDRVPGRDRVLATVTNLVRGALIGVAEAIPGVSGGTVALIVGIYETLINAIANAVLSARQLVGLGAGKASARAAAATFRGLPWRILVPVAIGMAIALILGARFIEPLLEEHPVQMRALFFGLVLAGVYVPAHMVIRTAPGGWRPTDLAVGAVAAIFLFGLTGVPPANVTDPGPIVIVLAAAVAICALVLPGVSGSFLLLSIGMYEKTISAVNDRDFGYIALFGFGAVIGLASFVTLLKWLLANRARITLVIITGFMTGSLRALWPWQSADRDLLAPSTDIGMVVLLSAAGLLAVVGLILVECRLGISEEQTNFG